MWGGGQVELLGEQGLRKVNTEALSIVGTKETKGYSWFLLNEMTILQSADGIIFL